MRVYIPFAAVQAAQKNLQGNNPRTGSFAAVQAAQK